MADDPRIKRTLGVAIPGQLLERPSGRVHRDHRRQSQSEVDVDDFQDEEISGVFEGEELRDRRSKRPTAIRLERLETKHDSLVATVTRVEVAQAKSHGELTGKLDTLVELAGASAAEREKRAAADAVQRAREDEAADAQRKAEAKEREQKRKHIVPIIKAIGIALALIAAAIIGHGAK
jgi:hypothetical protein